jgi:hypothetical protein
MLMDKKIGYPNLPETADTLIRIDPANDIILTHVAFDPEHIDTADFHETCLLFVG